MRTREVARLAAVVMAGVLLLAACGGGDSDDGDQAATDVADVDSGPDGDAGNLLAAGCARAVARFAEAQARVAEATGAAFTGDPTDLDEAAEQLSDLADAAPDEISEDFQVYADELVPFYEALGQLDFQPGQPPSQEQAQRFAEISEQVDGEALETAANNIQAWFESECAAG